jgi:acyl dehydratase
LLHAEPLVHGQTFEEMTVGSSFRTSSRTITETDMVLFRQLAGFTEPLFLDARHASESG